jgi:hypothetical protein
MPDVAGFLAAAERAISQLVQGFYRTWLAAVRGAVLAPYNRFRLSPDPNGVWAATPLWNSRIDRLMRELRALARQGWIDASDDIGEELPFDASSPILADQLQRTRNLMVRTPDEVYRRVIGELAKGGSIDEQAERVRRLLDFEGVENWESRARTVATTEVHRAYAFGGLAAALRLQQRLGPLSKRWDSRRDAAVRNGHMRAHGQVRPVSQPFEVSGEALMAPLDPSGSPSNIINCRCRAEYLRRR